MTTVRVLAYAYAAMAAYALLLVSLTSMTFFQLLPAMLQLGLCLALFAAGYSLSAPGARAPAVAVRRSKNWSRRLCFTLGPAALLSSILTTLYNTGMTPQAVFEYVRTGQSLYVNYQGYTEGLVLSGGGGGFTIWFALQVCTYAIALGTIFSIVSRGGTIMPREVLALALVASALAYSGVARGTGLEFFQLGSMFLFALLSRPHDSSGSNRRRLYAVLVGFALAVLYISILGARGYDASALSLGNGVELEESWFSDLVGPAAAAGILTFYGYFGFGFLYVATFWTEVWMVNPQSLAVGSLPGGLLFEEQGVRSAMSQVLDIGVLWHPDSMLLVSNWGMVGLFVACALLGGIAGRLDASATVAALILNYFVFLQMLAFPVGNFVWVDKAPLVVLVVLVVLRIARGLGLVPPSINQFFGGPGDSATLAESRSEVRRKFPASKAGRYARAHGTLGGRSL